MIVFDVNTIFAKQIGIINFFWRSLIKKFTKLVSLKFTYQVITKNNYNIHQWDPSATEVFMTQCFTDWGNEYLFLNSIMGRKNSYFLDIGCHSGYFPTLFKNYFEKIIGFEPSTKCINILKDLNNEKFTYHQCYVGDSDITVNGGDSKTGYSFYNRDSNHEQVNFKQMSQITLDHFCDKNKIKYITGIKIDVDGIDLNVLHGAKEIIKSNRPSILIENYTNELFDFFKNFNYSLLSITSSKNKPYNLSLEEFKNFDKSKWVKMMCCIPNEYKKNYETYFFKGNFLTGINKKKIIKTFNIK